MKHLKHLLFALPMLLIARVWNLGAGAWRLSVNVLGLRTEGEPLLDTLAPPL